MNESVLSPDDIPWEVLKRRGHESVRLMELTRYKERFCDIKEFSQPSSHLSLLPIRFYLELKKDPHGPETALFVGNMPPNLSQRQYEDSLLDLLEEGESLLSHSRLFFDPLRKFLSCTVLSDKMNCGEPTFRSDRV